MKKTFLTVLIFMLTACSDSNKDDIDKLRENDKKMSRVRLTYDWGNKPLESKDDNNSPDEGEYSLDRHPLAKYNKPEDVLIMNLFPRFEVFCESGIETTGCLAKLNVALETANDIGLEITEEQLKNPLFWKLQTSVFRADKEKLDSLMTKAPLYTEEGQLVIEKERKYLKEKRRRLKEFKDQLTN